MAPQLSKRLVIDRHLLERLVAARLREAEVLFAERLFSSAVYLSGYAVEFQLKATICKTLGLDRLPETFKTHDLELLLLHSGLHAKLNSDAEVGRSFKSICGLWKREMDLRYGDPEKVHERDASLFLKWVDGAEAGVVPWLQGTV